MNHQDKETVIANTKQWIIDVVIGCNFCPFAAKEISRESIYYEVLEAATPAKVLPAMMKILQQMDTDAATATAFLILPGSFSTFNAYLELLDLAERLNKKEKYEGIYQIAGFHPLYLFAGSNEADPSNYTNRSPYPMLHFLREDAVSNAVDNYPGIEEITKRNISFTKEKGLEYMKQLFTGIRNK
ncbi:MAG: DUF1415 domain-containing protein [Ferruginibacter sp.]